MFSINSIPTVPVTQVILAFGTLWALYLCGRTIYNIYWHPLAKFPGPKLHVATFVPYYWATWIGTEPMSTKKLHDEYGPVVRVNPDTLSFITAQSWKDIYGNIPGRGQLTKYHLYQSLGMFPTYKPPMSALKDHVEHARVRGLFSPAFSERAVREQESLITGYIDTLIQKLKAQSQGSEVDLVQWYNYTTFDIIGDLSLGQSFGSLENIEYHPWMSNIFKGIKKLNTLIVVVAFPLLQAIMSCAVMLYPKALEGQRVHREYTRAAVRKRLASKTENKDFMSYIIRPKNVGGLTVDEIDANADLIVMAGSETSATALSGATYYLLKQRATLEKVCKEVRGAFQRESDINFISVARLPYLGAVLEETLRIYTPVPSEQRRVTLPEGNIIDGHFVPGNTMVGVSGVAAYLSKTNFRDPESFIPERWLDDPLYASDQREACQPFSYGPRNCIGKTLAYAEMRTILARMLWNFDMELCEVSKDWNQQRIYLLWEKPALMVKLTERTIQ